MAQTAVTGFSEPFLDTHPFYRATYFRVVGRTATGPGNGTAESASGRTVTRLDRLVDYHTGFYKNGGRFYLGVRAIVTVTATAEGTGTASSVAQVLRQRQGTGSGVGSETAIGILVAVRSATGSGVGTMDSTGLHISPRTASGSGAGSDTTVGKILPVRSGTASGVGSATTISIHVVVRTSTGSGEGTSEATRVLAAIRTSSGSGEGTSTTVGARALFRTCTGSGDGTATANWDKSHIFRVPITEGYPFAVRLSEEAPDRLFSHAPQGSRAKNLYRLTDGSYTTTDPRRIELITRTYLGGHDNFLTAAEITELTNAGYASSIT
jgi:hypothetical protein